MEEHNHEHADHEAHTPKKNEKMHITVPGAIILAGFVIAIAVMVSAVMLGGHFSKNTPENVAGTAKTTMAVDVKNIHFAGEPFVGNAKAPVVLVYWSDYQCPFCKLFETTTFPTILKDYVQNGKVAVVFKDFSFLGNDSVTAALYGRAVWELYPDTYFAWREAMFNAQDGENANFGDEPSIIKLTSTVPGMDAVKVQKLVAEKKDAYQKLIDADRAEAASMGIEGTPSFVTGKTLIAGNSPIADFTKALDAQLK